jgi:alpha-beta hydrolase superfamily lysophospholipase
MAKLGYTTVAMGHRESGFAALAADVREYGVLPGVTRLVADEHAEQARLLDLDAALQWADGQCRAPFRVLLGHSMGAETVMLEAGAKNTIGVPSPPAAQDRFDAYVALSPGADRNARRVTQGRPGGAADAVEEYAGTAVALPMDGRD